MAKQNLSKKGVQRFNRKKLPKDAVRKNANLRLQHREAAQSRVQQQQQASKQQKADGKRKGGDPQALPQSFVRGKQVLLVGEGNLSFAHALVAHVLGGDGRGVTATTYDTEEEVTQARRVFPLLLLVSRLTVAGDGRAEVRRGGPPGCRPGRHRRRRRLRH